MIPERLRPYCLEVTERCPICDFSLHGLPDKHICPECGTPYELASVAIHHPTFVWKINAAVNGVMLIIGLALLFWKGTVNVLILIGFVNLIGALWTVHKPGVVTVVSATQIRVFRTAAEPVVYPLEKVAKAEWSPWTGRVTLYSSDMQEVGQIPARALGSLRRAALLTQAINAAVSART